jgi:uncharacterized protein YceK
VPFRDAGPAIKDTTRRENGTTRLSTAVYLPATTVVNDLVLAIGWTQGSDEDRAKEIGDRETELRV